ncbi:MAG: InlB B-repeat-containing protein [Ruminococcus sp.]|nr:InlB B-repeat-containing protein [Ruminococcus sp.]
MASCTSASWSTGSPQIKLTVTTASSTDTTVTYDWKLEYIAQYAASSSVAKSYTVKIDGKSVASGTCNIGGKTGTSTIKSGSIKISKGTSSRSVSFSCSMDIEITWNGTYKGTISASSSFTIAKKTSYTVSYNANGGSGTPASQTKWYGTTLKLSSTEPTKTGYTFMGWGTSTGDTSVDYSSGGNYTKNASITLYAIWRKKITLTYNANGGSGAPSSQSAYVYNSNTSYKFTVSSTKPTRTGYTFLGWSTSKSATTATYSGENSYTVSSNTTLYAVWIELTYTVSYNANGGSGAPNKQTKYYTKTLTLSSSKPTRSGYNFKGWASSSTTTTVKYAAGASYTANASITLYAVWEITYVKPRITGLTIKRCNSDGSSAETGTYALISFNWACDKTDPSIKVEWKTGTSFTGSTTISASGTSGTVSNTVIGGSLSSDVTYTISVTVADESGSTTVSKTLPSSKFIIDILNGGDGMAFGKAAELENYADFGIKTMHRDHSYFDSSKRIYAKKTIEYKDKNSNVISNNLEDVEVLLPCNGSGNTIVGYGNYERGVGNTNIYGADIHLGISTYIVDDKNKVSIVKHDAFRPYYRAGDSVTFEIHTAGYVTTGGKEVYFFVPIAKPIIGSPKVVATTGDGFLLRQNEKYTHGSNHTSDMNTYARPATYTVSYISGIGIKIIATFNNNTNATNNSPIGIRWHGTITFS